MKRSEFLAQIAAGAAAGPSGRGTPQSQAAPPEVVIEKQLQGRPHSGKVLAAIQPHADDLPLFAAGLILKLMDEGYTGYLIRTTNDDHTGPGTVGEGVLANERDNFAVARYFGLKKTYDLYYRNHMMDAVSPLELRVRLIFLFRLLKADTAFNADAYGPATIPFPGASYDPAYSKVLPDSGFLDVTVSPDRVTVDYVRAVLPGDESLAGAAHGEVSFSYSLP